MTSTAPRRHAPPEERRAQILAAALSCFASKGYHPATMDDLARAAGLSKGSLYWHFESKEGVLFGAFELFAAELIRRWDVIEAEGVPTLEALRRFAEVALNELADQRPLLGAWVEFLSHPRARQRMAEVYRECRERFAAALHRGIERGEVRRIPVDAAALGLIALFEGLALQALVDADLDPREEFRGVWELIGRSLEP